MRFTVALTAVFAAAASAAPLARRGVFTTKTYDELSISGGVAGNAGAEALAALAGLTDPAAADKADLNFLDSVNSIGNEAEKKAFNPAIAAAGKGTAEADALQRGKIKNKVLKLQATVLKLQAQAAQGQDVADKLATEQKKLANNIATDKKDAGKPSTKLAFDATTK